MKRFSIYVPIQDSYFGTLAANKQESSFIVKWMVLHPKKLGTGSRVNTKIFIDNNKTILS